LEKAIQELNSQLKKQRLDWLEINLKWMANFFTPGQYGS
jgi:hypothetical protein